MANRRYDRNGWIQWLDDEGCSHREDGPAEVWNDGEQFWYRHGDFHFTHGPADLYYDGRLVWYEDDQFLRERYPYG